MACADCGSGKLHQGTPVGRVDNIHGLPCYITEPPSGVAPKGIVVYLPDAFGWELINSRLLADSYARRAGVKVLLPDVNGGHVMSLSVMPAIEAFTSSSTPLLSRIPALFTTLYNFLPFLFLNRRSITHPCILSFVRSVRAQPEDSHLKLAIAAFCWSGYWAAWFCSEHPDAKDEKSGKWLVDTAWTAHPSTLAIPQDLENVKRPLGVAIGTKDFRVGMDGIKQITGVLQRNGTGEVKVVEGGKHGFAVRGNPDSEDEERQRVEAEDWAVEWWGRFLTK